MRPIEESCFWLATSTASTSGCSLAGEEKADIAIVGAGYTGLWTAFFLKQIDPSLDIIVLEQSQAGYGGSGRNAGIVSNCIDHSHALAIAHFGLDEARKLARIGLENIDELQTFAADCDFEGSGQLQVALTKKHIEDCLYNREVASTLGIQGYKYLSKSEIQAEIHSPLYLGGLFVPGGGVVNPIKLIDKLKRETIKMGVRLFERTPVLGIQDKRIDTAGGRVLAEKIVLATDAYTHHLFPHLLWRFIPLYDYILVSRPLSEAEQDSIGWRGRQGVLDGRTFFNYYRLTSDNRILWGTSEAKYYAPNRVDSSCDHSENHYESLRQSFRRHFPQLAGLEFPYAWGGPIASTTRLTPFFGTLSRGRIHYALGYTGHGIGSTRLAGKVLSSLVFGLKNEFTELAMVKTKPLPYPPEPLRSLAVQTVTASLRRTDAGKAPDFLLRTLDKFGISFSS